jgi:hypothetical protein
MSLGRSEDRSLQTNLDSNKAPEPFPDRRRHPRYHFSVPITIHAANGVAIPGITIEISESGLSAITANPLKITDTVELEPIAGGKVPAVVQRNVGRLYGFEFLNLTAEQIQRINESCKKLARYQANTLGI